jgi:hypothetical protein
MATVSGQIKPFSGFWRAERLPPVAPPLFHNCSIPIGAKTGRLNVDQHLKADVDPFRIERGSTDNRLAWCRLRKPVAPTDNRNEPVFVRPIAGAA